MNILDRHFRHIVCEGQLFNSYDMMAIMHPDFEEKDWELTSSGQWLLDPHTGEAKPEDEWQMDWLEDVHEHWEGLSWTEIENGLLMPVVCDHSDPEKKTFISADMAMEMMKDKDPELMKEIQADPCQDADIQEIWEAFWTYQLAKELEAKEG